MKRVLIIGVLIFIQPLSAFSINVVDYLLDSSIGQYSRSYPGACSEGSGILAGADHFDLDHSDYACDIRYYNKTIPLGVEVQVTQHTGGDSDKWLLHEMEASFRGKRKLDRLGASLSESASIREIDGKKIFDYGNVDYRWSSNNIVVYIHYTDLEGTKPEPLEVVKAYLAKHPSTISLTDSEVRSRTHSEQWIKDEMERRLWLGDKWFLQIQTGNAELSQVLRQAVGHMNVFLDYREKYYGVAALEEKRTLDGYLLAKDGTAIKNKLAEYKGWWTLNKGQPINLP